MSKQAPSTWCNALPPLLQFPKHLAAEEGKGQVPGELARDLTWVVLEHVRNVVPDVGNRVRVRHQHAESLPCSDNRPCHAVDGVAYKLDRSLEARNHALDKALCPAAYRPLCAFARIVVVDPLF